MIHLDPLSALMFAAVIVGPSPALVFLKARCIFDCTGRWRLI
jgi:hypothetical protein